MRESYERVAAGVRVLEWFAACGSVAHFVQYIRSSLGAVTAIFSENPKGVYTFFVGISAVGRGRVLSKLKSPQLSRFYAHFDQILGGGRGSSEDMTRYLWPTL